VKELEAKLRSHEQMGIGASTEIQYAARRVLEENKQLRALLRARGVAEPEIAAALGHAPAAPALTTLLERKRTSSGLSPEFSSVDLEPQSSPHSPSLSTDSIPRPPTVSSGAGISYPKGEIHAPKRARINAGELSMANAHLTPIVMAPISRVKHGTAPNYPYSTDQSSCETWVPQSQSNCSADALPKSYSTSCINAANIIRAQTDVGPELEADLGCHSPNQDCRVANPVVFNVLEKYSQQSLGM
jgi:hypothetical protein